MNKFFNFFVALILMAMTMAPKAMSQMVQPFPGSLFPSTENLPIGNASDDAALVALIGNDVYGNFQHGALFYVANGKLTYQQIGGETLVLSGSATLYKDDNLYVYKYENEGVAFKTQNGAIKEVVFKKSNYSPYAYKHIEFNESDLAAMMGEKVYVSEDEENFPATISVVNNKICMIAENQTIELSTVCSKMYKEGDLYVFADESEYFIFNKVNKTIGDIEYRKEINDQQDVVYFSAIANEADIAAALNGKKFALAQPKEVSFYAEGNQLVLYFDGEKQDMNSFKMVDFGDYFEISNNESGIRLYLSYSNNKVTRVSIEKELVLLYREMRDVTLEGELASLMGENVYVCVDQRLNILVDNGRIAMGDNLSASYLIDNGYTLAKDGNNYVLSERSATLTFFVENGQVSYVDGQNPMGSFLFYRLADENELVALMGSNEYFSTGMPSSIKVHEGNVYLTYENRGQQDGSALNIDYLLVKIDDSYKFIASFPNATYTFVVENDKVTKIVFDSPIMSYVYVDMSKITKVSEAALVALMGDNKYVNFGGSISVVNSHVYYEFGQGGSNLVEGLNLYKVNSNYVLMDAANYVFVVENGKVARIDCYNNEGITTYAIPVDLSGLAALIGRDTYVYNSGQIQKSISVDQIGNIILSDNGQTNHLNNGFFLYKDGDNYVFQKFPVSYTFIVENGQVTRIEYVDPENQWSLLKVADEAELIPLMGQNVYVGGPFSITVKDKHIVFKSPQMQQEILMVDSYGAPLKDGDNYIFTNGLEIITFVVENGQVIKIVNEGYMPYTLYPTVDKAELIALIGNDEYVNDEYDKKIYSSNGNLYNGDMEDVFNEYGLLLKAGDNYLYDGSYYVFTFIVENGKLTRIDYADMMMNENYSYINKMTTAIKKVNTTNEKAVKAIKTIKNGRIVIIKGNETYDLSGRRIK